MEIEYVAFIAIVTAVIGAVLRSLVPLIYRLATHQRSEPELPTAIPAPSTNGKYVRKDLCDANIKLMDARFTEAATQRGDIKGTVTEIKKDVRDLRNHLMEN